MFRLVPEPRAWHSVLVADGKMLMYGDNGECHESKKQIGAVLVFEFATCTWTRLQVGLVKDWSFA